MHIKFAERILITRSQEYIFDYSQDYGRRLQWDTFLKKAMLAGGATQAGPGVRAWCVAKDGLGMETEYISFNRPAATAIKMTKGPFLFKSFLGSWTFKRKEQDRTEVIFLYAFKLRFPFSIFSRQIKRSLQMNVQQRLKDLKQHIEKSNDPV
ncbi:SRPBCC family protein [Niabella sp. CC-SYL272]|uniref:SRPBCC family protein n=1 Tax=Niabella agricola TaxID=2891571 RepID=UPI001F1A5ED7|nr:SRPBCC family protein [Niabella agricola]MCF3109794.1 SRPBCC family protein [Niabella agricola]